MKTWYRVVTEKSGGWFKCNTLEDVIEKVKNPSPFSGPVKRIIEVSETELDVEYFKNK